MSIQYREIYVCDVDGNRYLLVETSGLGIEGRFGNRPPPARYRIGANPVLRQHDQVWMSPSNGRVFYPVERLG